MAPKAHNIDILALTKKSLLPPKAACVRDLHSRLRDQDAWVQLGI